MYDAEGFTGPERSPSGVRQFSRLLNLYRQGALLVFIDGVSTRPRMYEIIGCSHFVAADYFEIYICNLYRMAERKAAARDFVFHRQVTGSRENTRGRTGGWGLCIRRPDPDPVKRTACWNSCSEAAKGREAKRSYRVTPYHLPRYRLCCSRTI